MQAFFVDHPAFAAPAWNSLHPLAFSRHAAVRALVEAMGWLPRDCIVEAILPDKATLERFHAPHYVAALEGAIMRGKVTAAERERYGFGSMENPIFPGLFDRARATVGGAIVAARKALDGSIAFHPAGGTHHGKRDRASGFCYFNDPAFAIAEFLSAGAAPVLYLDLDAHHGDGVEQLFAGDPRVRLVSIHEEGRWPQTGNAERPGPVNATNIVLPRNLNDSELDWLMAGPIADIATRLKPQAIVVTAGADCLHGDPLSTMELSNRALWRAVEIAVRWAPHAVVVGGGGYNPWTVARGWAGLWATLAGFDPTAPLSDLARAQLAAYESDLVDVEDIEPEWRDAIADSPRPGRVRDLLKERAHAR